MPTEASIIQAFDLAREAYETLGVDVDRALVRLAQTPISLHCWQGDDVGGFETAAGLTGGGIQATGKYPGKARTVAELRADLEAALRLIPGSHRVNLHAIYGEWSGQAPPRNQLDVEHFQGWIDWAREHNLGLDFNPTFFSHPLADDGFTLSHHDGGVRRFWIEHGIACRRIGAAMGAALDTPCVNNFWIPDGFKDQPVDRRGPRERLRESLDEIFAHDYPADVLLDAVEGKLFGIGSESYVVGSHEFYLGYAVARRKLLCLDAGHFHPTETIADKISATLCHVERLLLHVSRGVRWDSDHVVIMNDDLRTIAEELVRGECLDRVHIGLDFFDASINRVAAWVIGVRSTQRALLAALLEPTAMLRRAEQDGDYTTRLALLEELKTMPFGAIWDFFCLQQETPVGAAWLEEVRRYERDVLAGRHVG